MRKLRALWIRFIGLLHSGSGNQDFSAELESHIAMHVEDGLRIGLAPSEARRQALLRLGGAEQMRQAYRERVRLPWLEDLLRDLLYGVRTLSRQKAATRGCRPHARYRNRRQHGDLQRHQAHSHRPVALPACEPTHDVVGDGKERHPKSGNIRHLLRTRASRTVPSIRLPSSKGGSRHLRPTSAADRPERLDGQRVSANYFRTLGISPLRGRDFQASDDRFRGPNVVILSDKLWRSRFGSDAAIVGKQIRLDDALYTVIGVMPSEFENVLSTSAEIWAPLQYDPSLPCGRS